MILRKIDVQPTVDILIITMNGWGPTRPIFFNPINNVKN